MVPRADIVAVQQEIPLGELLKVFKGAAHSRLVVYNDTLDDPLGMVHIRDLIAFMTARAAVDPEKPSRRKKQRIAGLDLGAHGLVRLPIAEKHGMIFVRPRPLQTDESVAIDIDAELGPIAGDLAALRLDTFPYYSTDRVQPRINWKFAVDTFLEGYHIAHLHRKTIAPYFIGGAGTFDSAGLNGRMCVAKTSIDALRQHPEAERNYRKHVVAIYQIFPNTLIIWQLDHIEIWRAFPGRDDASHCDVEMTIYKPQDSPRPDSYWEKNRDIAIRTVLEEDFPLGERMQIGFESGATEEVIYGRNEPSLVHFHRSIRTALGVPA